MAPVFQTAAALALPALAMSAAVSKDFPVSREIQTGPVTDVVGSPDIVGGTAASLGEFPYLVSLSYSGSHFCGGVLLNAYTVLTAAHCSVDYGASSVKVRAGSLTWASGGTQVGVKQIVVNPDYNANTIDNDIALWHLSSPLTASSTIGYVTLPAQGEDPTAGASVTTAGWGLTSENGNSLPASARKVTVPVVARSTCQSEYGGASVVTNNMFCAAASGKDSCSGDSGGPIVDASTKVLQGTVSWGQGCAEAGYAGVYSRIGNYVTYIKSGLWTS